MTNGQTPSPGRPLRFRVFFPQPGAGAGPVETVLEVRASGDELAVGRAQGTDIHLPLSSVSGRHARISRDAQGWTVEDLGSVNGTWVENLKLTRGHRVTLRPGSTLRVAEVKLIFEGEAPEKGRQGAPLEGGGPPVETTGSLARKLVEHVFQGLEASEPIRLRVKQGPDAGRQLLLSKTQRPYRVGRDPACDLVLTDDDVSRVHLEIERTWAGIRARDTGSKNGVYRGETPTPENRLEGDVLLSDGALLRLGATVLVLEDPHERYLRQLGLAETEPPPPPGDRGTERGAHRPTPGFAPAGHSEGRSRGTPAEDTSQTTRPRRPGLRTKSVPAAGRSPQPSSQRLTSPTLGQSLSATRRARDARLLTGVALLVLAGVGAAALWLWWVL